MNCLQLGNAFSIDTTGQCLWVFLLLLALSSGGTLMEYMRHFD